MIFDFTENETNLILQALGELPAKISIGLLNKIQMEGSKQMNEHNHAANLKKVEPIEKGNEDGNR